MTQQDVPKRETQPTPVPADQTNEVVGAIDIGSNSIRMAIAQITPEGVVEMLERLVRGVRLGQDTFRRGFVGARTMRAAAGILRDYKSLLELYAVRRVRAVATSAVREAGNVDAFLDRMFMASGLDVQVIDPSEESRLTVSAVHEALADQGGLAEKRAVVVEVGGGSTVLTLLHQGEVLISQSLPLGTVRLQEVFATSSDPVQRAVELLSHQIESVVANAEEFLNLERVETVVAMGADARFVADQQEGRWLKENALRAVPLDDFQKVVKRCRRYMPEQLVKRYGVPFENAETLNAALLIYQVLLDATAAREMIVSYVSMRDALVLDFVRQARGDSDVTVVKGVLHAAGSLAEKYQVELHHAAHVSDIAVSLFDALRSEHGLGHQWRLLLRVAALLHETGQFISTRAHHKHSYYTISNSEIFGLTQRQVHMAALVARYHRRSRPKPSHAAYMALSREERVTVSKLAALLRVADSLDANRLQQLDDLEFELKGEELICYVNRDVDLTLERRSLNGRSDMLEDVFGLRLLFQER